MLILYFALEYELFSALAAVIFHHYFHVSLFFSILGAGLAGSYLTYVDFRHRGIWILLDNLRVSRLAFLGVPFLMLQALNVALALGWRPWP